ncbi:peptidoglycan-binding protein [Streptacidiphilus rugosus]|uniref:peptidoglycan-binding protein n=1 Tax=Streptacidiphilus rugosus TaxID=405783 RepID=UPI00056457FB|nr:peptidoglycan-binding protein [Streptacidiphilus rugosus]
MSTHPDPLRRRRKAVLVAAVAALLVSGGGVVGAGFVQSPSQAAADTLPPRASVITAPVERQVLRQTVVLRGTFSDGRTVSATPTSVAGTASAPTGAGAGTGLMVTAVFVYQGDLVRAGRPLVEYSGRPVFALPGVLPMYRDLVPTARGKDVAQLQAALHSLGYSTGPDGEGTFGPGTKRAVTHLYRSMGYDTPVTGAATAAAVKAAQQQLDTLRAQHGASPSQLAQAQTDLAQAEAADGTMVPASEVVFVPTLPARVAGVPVAVGDTVKGPVITLARGGMTLTGMLDPSVGGLVKAGMRVSVLSETTGQQAAGTVDSVGSLTTSSGTASGADAAAPGGTAPTDAGPAYLPLIVRPDQPWPNSFAGQDVRITITAAATSGPVLAVPEAAISAGADTRTTVTVQDGGGALRTVTVSTGVSADGMVEVTPTAGVLATGDRVVVGQ